MRRPPNPGSANIFDRWMVINIVWVGLVMGLLSLFAGNLLLSRGQAYWQTMVFTTLTLSQVAFAMAVRSDRQSIFRIGFLTNRSLILATFLTFGLQMALIYVPFLNDVFSTTALQAREIALALGLSGFMIVVTEVVKWFDRRRSKLN
jgi:Ca2+-transporting ATPase